MRIRFGRSSYCVGASCVCATAVLEDHSASPAPAAATIATFHRHAVIGLSSQGQSAPTPYNMKRGARLPGSAEAMSAPGKGARDHIFRACRVVDLNQMERTRLFRAITVQQSTSVAQEAGPIARRYIASGG